VDVQPGTADHHDRQRDQAAEQPPAQRSPAPPPAAWSPTGWRQATWSRVLWSRTQPRHGNSLSAPPDRRARPGNPPNVRRTGQVRAGIRSGRQQQAPERAMPRPG
jgi:hypothetical protein